MSQGLRFSMSQQLPPHSGLRALQGRKELEKLVKRVKNTRDQMQWGARGPPPLLIKLAPDLTDTDKSDIATVCLRLGVDGLVVSNTTITRPGAVADHPTGSEASGNESAADAAAAAETFACEAALMSCL